MKQVLEFEGSYAIADAMVDVICLYQNTDDCDRGTITEALSRISQFLRLACLALRDEPTNENAFVYPIQCLAMDAIGVLAAMKLKNAGANNE